MSVPFSSRTGQQAAFSLGDEEIARGRETDGLAGVDKKSIGDVFYDSAAARGEALVDAWLRQKGSSRD